MNDSAAIKTYQYLRIAMVGVVVLLVASVLFERAEVDCWQTSISAYYYTPVKAILVGGLMAIGLCLIVIKGNSSWEDSFLNFAGMLAPIVAVVPTSTAGTCWSIEPNPRPVVDGELAPWVIANIDNNVKALLVVGIIGLVVALVLGIRSGDLPAALRDGGWGTRVGLIGAVVIIVGGGLAFLYWDDFYTKAHSVAAIAMFVFLAAVVAIHANEHREERDVYFWLYTAIAVLMVVVAIVIFAAKSKWDHAVLALEAIEIALFATFWLAQTVEHWDGADRPRGPSVPIDRQRSTTDVAT
jgi:hypothetical protein